MRHLVLALCLVLAPAVAFGAASDVSVTNTTSTTTVSGTNLDGVSVIALDWLSNATGDADCTVSGVRGLINRVTFKPDSGGTQPTNAYDITLKDEDGIDILVNGGANLSNTTATSIACMVVSGSGYWPMAVAGDLTLAVNDAGNAKGGIIRIYYTP